MHHVVHRTQACIDHDFIASHRTHDSESNWLHVLQPLAAGARAGGTAGDLSSSTGLISMPGAASKLLSQTRIINCQWDLSFSVFWQ